LVRQQGVAAVVAKYIRSLSIAVDPATNPARKAASAGVTSWRESCSCPCRRCLINPYRIFIMTKIVAVTGNLNHPSRTHSLAQAIAQRAARETPAQIQVIDIAELAAELGSAVSFNNIPAAITRAHALLAGADLVILASPVYKGSYSGLLKHFLDLLDPAALRGKVVILAATGGSDRHALVLEHQLRPLASFFESITVPAGIFVRDGEFVNYQLPEESAEASWKRIDLAVAQALSLLPQQQSAALAA
jgi:FMN reductase